MKYRFLTFIFLAVVGVVAAVYFPVSPRNMIMFILVELCVFGLGVWAGYYTNKELSK